MPKKRKKTKLTKAILLAGLVLLVLNIYLFLIGFHNADHCQNIERISLMENLDIVEVRLDGKIWDTSECYLSGLRFMLAGFFGGIISAFIIGSVFWRG